VHARIACFYEQRQEALSAAHSIKAYLEHGKFFLFLYFFCEIELISLKFMHDSCEIPALQIRPVVIIGRHVKETEK